MEETTIPTTLNAAAYTPAGKRRDRVSLPTDVFDGTVNMPVMHQAVKAYLSNRRLGLAATKTRGFVAGGNQKPWRQKGTGRALQGSTRAPHWVGGGTVFGPTPRSYAQTLPKKIRQLARKSALNARAREDALIVVDSLDFEKPSTRQLVSLLGAVGAANKKVLLLTDGLKHNVFLSGRNLQETQVMQFTDVTTYHILWSDVVIIESGALGTIAPDSGEEREETTRQPKRGANRSIAGSRSAKPAGKTATAARKQGAGSAARKSTTKKAAKKTAAKKTAKKSAPKKKKGK